MPSFQNQAQQPFVPQDDKRLTSLEKSLEAMANSTTQSNNRLETLLSSFMQNSTQSIAKLEMQMSQLANLVSERERGTFPSQPITNPRNANTNSSQANVVQDSNLNQMNAITTLRSGKVIDNQVVNPNDLPDVPLDTLKTKNDSNPNIESNPDTNSESNSFPIQEDHPTEFESHS